MLKILIRSKFGNQTFQLPNKKIVRVPILFTCTEKELSLVKTQASMKNLSIKIVDED